MYLYYIYITRIILCEVRGKESTSWIPVSKKKKNQFKIARLHLCSTHFTSLYPNIASQPV